LPEKLLATLLFLFSFVLALAASGCANGAPSGFGSTNPSPVVQISASPTSISSGQSATLTVSVANATQVTITGSDGSSYTMTGNGGQQTVSPSATTTYTATATGPGGSASSQITITVTTASGPQVTITSDPATVMPGGSSVLTVAAKNATQVTLTGSDGSSYALSATGGTQTVRPSTTTTYTATAKGSSGIATATTIVTVSGTDAPPIVTITANPTTVSSGQSSVLTVAAGNATQVTVTGSDGSSYTLAVSGGTQTVSPSSTTIYTATAVGAHGTATATAIVSVNAPAPPTVAISANPDSIGPGQSAVLSVSGSNDTALSISGSDGTTYMLPPSGGTQTVSPTATTTYTATATGAGGKVTATAVVTVVTNPTPTVAITASPTTITAGTSSMLSVTATNATQVTITGTDGSTYNLAANGGTQAVSPTATTTYTATATGNGKQATASTTVMVIPVIAPTVSIVANPGTISAGDSSVLTVSASNATQVTVTGTDGSHYTLSPTGGTQSVSPSTTTTYTATATGAGGSVSQSTVVTVKPNPPPTVTITANPQSIQSGSSSILTVSATYATQVTIFGSDGSHYTLPTTGGTQSVSPTATTTYTATATGAGGTQTATVTVTVTPIPAPTVTISASPSSIQSGSSSTLTVTAAYATSVTISGSDGSHYTLSGTGGTQSVSPTVTTTYTATATGTGGTSTASTTVTVQPVPTPTVTISASPSTITQGSSSTLTVTATNSNQVTVTGNDGSSYTLPSSGGTQVVSPTATTIYTATATGPGGTASQSTTVTVNPPGSVNDVNHVIFMLQENHTFDNYFGMLNPYRAANGWNVGADGNTYTVDGIDDKLTTISNTNDQGTTYYLFKFKSTCIDDESSDWLASFGDVNTYNFLTTRPILMDGFVHNAEGYANSCSQPGATCSGSFTDLAGQRAMGYYDQGYLNYYYYMASQFAISDRWFSPIASKSIDNRIATFTGGTTQGLVKDPEGDDHLNTQLAIPDIFSELNTAKVTWKIYYTVTQGFCTTEDDCPATGSSKYPATDFSNLTASYQYLYIPSTLPATASNCTPPTMPSSVVGDTTNSFCIDPTHIAPIADPNYGYYHDLQNGTLPSFAFIEAGYGNNDEHPGSGQSILLGQQEVANVVNAFMNSSAWKDSIFFLSYDEGGGPYDHVPPVPGHTNDYTDTNQLANYPTDISSIAVNPDNYYPCVPPTPGTATLHCDLSTDDPGANPDDAASSQNQGFAAQLGFRLPNIVISPFTRAHYVSHIPMDHTAIIKFVENRFIGPSAHLTQRDAVQPNLLDFFNFTNPPWATPPTPPTPVSLTDPSSPGYNTCTPTSM
jgi:phospholipase C